MLRSSLARGKKNFLYTLHRINCLDSGTMMNPTISLSTVGTSHVGKSLNSFRTQTTGFLNRSGRTGNDLSHKLGLLRVRSGAGFEDVLYGTTMSSSGKRHARAFASSGGDSGSNNGNGGGGDDNNDGYSSSGGWFGKLWIMYLAQLDKNPVSVQECPS
jgi:hypothetical protein